MEYCKLGQTGLKVSVTVIGTMTFDGKETFARVNQMDVEKPERLNTNSSPFR
jgi:aryl-alcohol dehydrogenase-like predicted oxidoreductase